MTRRERDEDGWPVVTEPESWLEVISAGLCLFLVAFALIAYVLVFAGMAVEAPR